VGPQQGRKVFTLQTLPAVGADDRYGQVVKEAGFNPGYAADVNHIYNYNRDTLSYVKNYTFALEQRFYTAAGILALTLDTSQNAIFAGLVTATNFEDAGTYLTGTAANLTAGSLLLAAGDNLLIGNTGMLVVLAKG
jgi:hypothetical protein